MVAARSLAWFHVSLSLVIGAVTQGCGGDDASNGATPAGDGGTADVAADGLAVAAAVLVARVGWLGGSGGGDQECERGDGEGEARHAAITALGGKGSDVAGVRASQGREPGSREWRSREWRSRAPDGNSIRRRPELRGPVGAAGARGAFS